MVDFEVFSGEPPLVVFTPLVALSNDRGVSLVATSDQGYAPWKAVAF